jgi:hypothetical protein
MPKATVVLVDGTKIEIDGTLEEVQRLTEHYGRPSGVAQRIPKSVANGSGHVGATGDEENDELDVAAIAAIVRDCDESEVIEGRILDHNDVLNRVLLCLWVVHKYVSQTMGLTSGDVERITNQLGVKIAGSNASNVLSGKAKSYVAGDVVRKRGGKVRYRLNRRGVQYFENVLNPS